MTWETGPDIHTLTCIKQTAGGNPLCSTGSSAPCSLITQRGWDGGWEEGPRGWRYTLYIADSLGCTAQTSTTLYSNYTPVKKTVMNTHTHTHVHPSTRHSHNTLNKASEGLKFFFICVCMTVLPIMIELNEWFRQRLIQLAHNTQTIYHLTLYRRNFPSPDLANTKHI